MRTGSTYRVVVPAAGAGRRMGSGIPKQYLPLAGKTVIEHTLDALLSCPYIDSILVAVAADDPVWPDIEKRYHDISLATVTGGNERCHSVLNALDHLAQSAQDSDWVLVHDAARPCLRSEDIVTLIDTLADDDTGGLLGVPVADTMKQIDANARIKRTVAREGLWHALTPQMFRLAPLRTALRQTLAAGELVTDEAAAMELAGHRPRMVQGHRDNIKITLPADLALAAFYLQGRATT